MGPQTERFEHYLARLTAKGIVESRNRMPAARQFMGMLRELSLWPWMNPEKHIIEQTTRMVLQHHRAQQSKRRGPAGAA